LGLLTLADEINILLERIEQSNQRLAGALTDQYFTAISKGWWENQICFTSITDQQRIVGRLDRDW